MASPIVQVKKTTKLNSPPTGLAPGEIAVEMDSPFRVWVGVPFSINSDQRRLVNIQSTVSATAPLSPKVGDMWFDNAGNGLYIAVDNAGTIQWTKLITGTTGPAPIDAYTKTESDARYEPVGYSYSKAESNNINAAQDAAINNRVLRTGDTMTGALTISAGTYSSNLTLYDSSNGQRKTVRMGAGGTFEVVNTANSAVIMSLADYGLFWAPQVTSNGVFSTTGTQVILAPGASGYGVYLRPRSYNDTYGECTVDTQGVFSAYMHSTYTGINGGYSCKDGGTNTRTADWFNMLWDPSGGYMHLYVNNTHLGSIYTISDYRVKKDIEPLPTMWGTVKALNPIKYTHKDYTPSVEEERVAEHGGAPFIVGDNIERWGFIAHELQETLTPSVANGVKDAPGELQSPNPFPVIAALTKALQEAMSRIEALEAASTGVR